MKKLFVLLTALIIALPSLTLAAGSCTWSATKCDEYSDECYIVTASCTASGGAVTGDTMPGDIVSKVKRYYVYEQGVVVPGANVDETFVATVVDEYGLTVTTNTACAVAGTNSALDLGIYNKLTGAWVVSASSITAAGTFQVKLKFLKP
jgi:hypothetical protein